MQPSRVIGIAAAGVALVLGGFALGVGLPVGAQETPSDEPAAEAPAEATEPCLPGRHGRFGLGEDLAAALGISVDELRTAAEAAHEQVVAELGEFERPESRPTTEEEREALRAQMEERRAAFEAALAGQLGISVEELEAAEIAAVETRLAEAVANGRLTQERADEILEAVRNGERPVFPGRGGRGHGGFRGGPGGFGPGGAGAEATPSLSTD